MCGRQSRLGQFKELLIVRKILFILPLIAVLAVSYVYADHADLQDISQPNFTDCAEMHLKSLTFLGIRDAGSERENKAIDYISRQFKQIGLQVSVEPFEFESYEIKQAILHIGKHQFTPSLLVFNPYASSKELIGQAVWATPIPEKVNGAGKIFLSDTRNNFIRLMLANPVAVAFVDTKDSEAIRELSGQQARLEITGESSHLHSSNVVASLIPEHSQGKEILLSAHLDSVGGPGANDNASGVAVLLALAQYLSDNRSYIPCPIRFIAFGSEEVGMLGSRAYVEHHSGELSNCRLLCNLDTVGRGGDIMMDLPKSSGNTAAMELPAQFRHKQLGGKNWLLLEPSVMPINYAAPEWLLDVVSTCSKETGISVRAASYSGSDHMSFANSGLPITSVVVGPLGDSKIHTPEDTIDKVNIENLTKVGRLVAAIVKHVMSPTANP